MFKKIKINFFTGLLVVIPLVLTLWVLYFIISMLNVWLLDPIMRVLENWFPGQSLEFLTKIIILLILLSFLTLLGFATRILLIKNIIGFGERLLYKVPLINTIYGGLKEISFAFFDHKKSIFKRVVLIEYPRKGAYSVGFVTSETKGLAQESLGDGGDVVNVFVPTTPNPATGMLVLVPSQEIIELDMPVSEGIKMVLSGGAVNPSRVSHGDTENRGNTFKEEGSQGD